MHVVVTGGSSGIGLEVAAIYARRGASVSLIARDGARLQRARDYLLRLAQGQDRIFVAAADVAKPEELGAAIAACEAIHGQCDVLLASAGVVEPGWFHHQSPEAEALQWATNFTGAVNAVRHVYGAMTARRGGQIMIVSSAAAFIGLPGYTAYCASKSALTGFTEALRLEAIKTGVFVGICFPPDTETPQLSRERHTRPLEAEILMGRVAPWSAAQVAHAIVRGIDRRKPRIYFKASIMALAMLGQLARPAIEVWYRFRTRHL